MRTAFCQMWTRGVLAEPRLANVGRWLDIYIPLQSSILLRLAFSQHSNVQGSNHIRVGQRDRDTARQWGAEPRGASLCFSFLPP